MAETDTENRHLAEQLTNIVLSIGNRFRVSRTVTQEYPVRIHGDDIFCRGIGRHNSYPAASFGKVTQDIAFDAEVISDNFELTIPFGLTITATKGPDTFLPLIRRLTGNFLYQVLAD